jgi:P27 family predicted phage terminase small subunit
MPRGPVKTPTNLQILKGNPNRRPLPKGEPKPPVELPKPPSSLTEDEVAIWYEIGEQLVSAGLMTRLDAPTLEMLCVSYARWKFATAQLSKEGLIIRASNGIPMASPYWKIANTAFDHVRRLLLEFGMSPSSRSRVRSENEPTKENEEWSDY